MKNGLEQKSIQAFLLAMLFITIPFTGILVWFGVDRVINKTIIINEDNIERISDRGLGTEEEPFVIENRLVKTNRPYGVRIRRLTSFLTIQNCTFKARNVGMRINNCYEGIIQNNRSLRLLKILNNSFIDCTFESSYSNFIEFSNNCIKTNLVSYNHGDFYWTIKNNIFQISYLHFEGGYFNIENNKFINCSLIDFSSSNSSLNQNFLDNSSMIVKGRFNEISYNTFQNFISDYVIRLVDWNDYVPDGDQTFNSIHHNNFINNNLGGESQAFDDSLNNTWFDPVLFEGNFWSNYNGTGYYYIDGSAETFDPYPLLIELIKMRHPLLK